MALSFQAKWEDRARWLSTQKALNLIAFSTTPWQGDAFYFHFHFKI